MSEKTVQAAETENTTSAESQEDYSGLTVEESFKKLDEMLKTLESDEVSLEESFHIYQEGMNILKSVHAKIDGYEKNMQILSEDGVIEDF